MDKAKTAEHPNGEAHLLWKYLKEKYEPKDGVNRVAMIKQMFSIGFKEDKDPYEFFGEMAGIKSRYETATKKLSADLQMAAVVIQAPAIYDDVIAAEQRSKGDAMTMENLEEAMRTLYRVKIEAKKIPAMKTNDGENELNLAFVGKCYNCGETGHIASKCPNEKKSGSFSGKCFNCGKRGHRKGDCNKPGGGAFETANINVDQDIEVLI